MIFRTVFQFLSKHTTLSWYDPAQTLNEMDFIPGELKIKNKSSSNKVHFFQYFPYFQSLKATLSLAVSLHSSS